MYDLITIGHLLQDVFIFMDTEASGPSAGFNLVYDTKHEVFDMQFDLGGTACNVAVGLANLGFKTALVSKVGTDSLGRQLLQELVKKKVRKEFVVNDPLVKTGSGLMIVDAHGQKTALVFSGAGGSLKISDIPLTKLKTSWLYMSSLNGDLKMIDRLVSSVKKKNTKIAFNPGSSELDLGLKNLLPTLRQVDALLLNMREAQQLANLETEDIEALIDSLVVTTPGLVLISDGERGAYLSGDIEEDEIVHFAPALKNKLVDSSGAGDALAAGFLAGILKYDDKLKALQLATLNASQVVAEIGAQRGLLASWPSPAQLAKVRVTKV